MWENILVFFFFQAEDGIRDLTVTGVQTCALPISAWARNASESRITGVMYFVARRTASIATSKQSVAVAAANTASGASAFRPWTACSRSDCSAFVGMPAEGPARWELTTTSGSSVAIARPSISIATELPLVEIGRAHA